MVRTAADQVICSTGIGPRGIQKQPDAGSVCAKREQDRASAAVLIKDVPRGLPSPITLFGLDPIGLFLGLNLRQRLRFIPAIRGDDALVDPRYKGVEFVVG